MYVTVVCVCVCVCLSTWPSPRRLSLSMWGARAVGAFATLQLRGPALLLQGASALEASAVGEGATGQAPDVAATRFTAQVACPKPPSCRTPLRVLTGGLQGQRTTGGHGGHVSRRALERQRPMPLLQCACPCPCGRLARLAPHVGPR